MNEWVYWLSDKHPEELATFLWAFLLFDLTRYALIKLCFCIYDIIRGVFPSKEKPICPTVSVLLAGYNESAGIESTLQSLWGTYPNLQIIVIDDGSTDNMAEVAQNFANSHSGVLVLRRQRRGGKASATNYGFAFSTGEIIVVIDTDSTVGENAIWEIVQPFRDGKVGGVSGNLIPRNIFTNLLTWFQAYEYLHSISIGRLVSSRLGILGIVSGAFGAFRREAWERVGGMDVGPPEDLDFTLKLRKSGYTIAFAPYSTCYTDVPETLTALTKQRFRWEQGGVVRNFCRKHLDLTDFKSANFRWSNFILWLETFFFDFVCPYIIIAYFLWLFGFATELNFILAWLYIVYSGFDIIQIAICLFYSKNIGRDLGICLIFPLVFIYRSYLLVIRAVANTQELLWRVSYEDNYVPKHVRESTWHW